MAWFRRQKPGLVSQPKKDVPDGLWLKCDGCGEIIYKKQLSENQYVCTQCDFHFKISDQDYIDLLLDKGSFKEINSHLQPIDFLKFKDTKKYSDRLKTAQKKTGSKDAIRTGFGYIAGHQVVFGVMNFAFIGGSMGSVVGEKVARAIDQAHDRKMPLILICATGGARMMESIVSLMQMAKTSAKLARFSDGGGLYIPILTNPTTAGIVASFAMLGDIHIAEPGALIGFAGPRVIKRTIGQDLPEGFQRAQFQQDHGFVDMVVNRREMRQKLIQILSFFNEKNGIVHVG